MICKRLEACINTRSYLIWEREGRVPGHEREHWARARAEIEQELLAALEGITTDFVPPAFQISQRPVRY